MEIHGILMCFAVVFCYCKITDQYSPEEWITELDVVAGDKDVQCKEGFTKIPQNLNDCVRDSYHVYACIKKGEPYKTPLNSIVVLKSHYGKQHQGCPKDRVYEFISTDLNYGIYTALGIYFCFSRGRDTKITAIDFHAQDSKSVTTSARANETCNSQDLNDGAGGKYIFMCYSYDETDILEVRLEDVVYDLTQKVDSFYHLDTVQDVSISNPSDFDTAPATFTGTFAYTSSSKWQFNNSDANELGYSLTVTAGIPEFDPVIGWLVSEKQTVETKVGLGTSTSVATSYSISCSATQKTIAQCGGVYKQGRISVPYNATKTTKYTDGTSKVLNITDYMYDGTARAVLEIYQKVAKQL